MIDAFFSPKGNFARLLRSFADFPIEKGRLGIVIEVQPKLVRTSGDRPIQFTSGTG